MLGCWREKVLLLNGPVLLKSALADGEQLLYATTPTPRLDATMLLEAATGRDRAWLFAHDDADISESQYRLYMDSIVRRAVGVPVPYLTGSAGFYKRTFVITENVLVPRPETEHLVGESIGFLRERLLDGAAQVSVFEPGVGSGAIACTIAAEVPQALLYGTDISQGAVDVATTNAERLHVRQRCTFVNADIIENGHVHLYDLIVANLPYIPTLELPHQPDPAGFEPRVALDGGPDGMKDYRALLTVAPKLLRVGGAMLMEAAPATMPLLVSLARSAFPDARMTVGHDYAGLERYLYVRHAGPGLERLHDKRGA